MATDKPARLVKRLGTLALIGLLLACVAVIVPAIQQARTAARRSDCKSRMRQIAMGLASYSEEFQVLPPGGVFNSDGVGYHGWPALIQPGMAQHIFHTWLDYREPWDSPKNVAVYQHSQPYWYSNPEIDPSYSTEGWRLNHFPANQSVLYRNSSVRWSELDGNVVLFGEATENFAPLGNPYDWRDVRTPLCSSPDSFASIHRNSVFFASADSRVIELSVTTAPEVIDALAGPKRSPDEVAKPIHPYQLKKQPGWLFVPRLYRDDKAEFVYFWRSPDESYIKVNGADSKERNERRWSQDVVSLVTPKTKHVEVRGSMRASDLEPLLAIPNLTRLTLTDARIYGDPAPYLSKARPEIQVEFASDESQAPK